MPSNSTSNVVPFAPRVVKSAPLSGADLSDRSSMLLRLANEWGVKITVHESVPVPVPVDREDDLTARLQRCVALLRERDRLEGRSDR